MILKRAFLIRHILLVVQCKLPTIKLQAAGNGRRVHVAATRLQLYIFTIFLSEEK